MENALMGIGAWQQELLDPGGVRENGRKKGLGKTMIIDKGLGLSAFRDLLEVSGRHIDMVKLAFGTAVLYEPDIVLEKLQLAAKQGIIVMPGGTLMETAIVQGAVPRDRPQVAQGGTQVRPAVAQAAGSDPWDDEGGRGAKAPRYGARAPLRRRTGTD